MEREKYNPTQDYCEEAKNFQAVPSFEQYHESHPDIPLEKIDGKRAETLYSCPDNYQMGTIQDNQIYIATTNEQHDQVVKGEHIDAQGGLSGYFSDQATVDACRNGDGLDNTKYNEACQIAPYRYGGIEGTGDAAYKPHVDCFEIDKDALYKNYGTYDFNAAISKCEANNQFGSGGGNQGYNPHISEMIDNGTLKYNRDKSYSDNSISKSENCNPNQMTNSIVPEDKADKMYADAHTRAHDCVNNNTPHPSETACKNGFDKSHAIDVGCSTGNANSTANTNAVAGTLPQQSPEPTATKTEKAGALPQKEPENSITDKQIAGTTPDKKQDLDIKNHDSAKTSIDNAKAASSAVTNGNGIT